MAFTKATELIKVAYTDEGHLPFLQKGVFTKSAPWANLV